ncbi:cis-2,3-dihydrobiphenyl-2,3-diol dehydrogenase (plasmid) [Rhodococcus opacus]|uniref:Cis-2,3-dihydrobiphenyl-2,3-diol dehydrogenase n=1 Tax=Rhodococcus opacus TaxID=37919 RepID=A0A1B1KH46_RHOOP|nr:SDR family oxidoreductase [Rhodococcus opacus]ANS31927.1 cis-2,3-dihydrobiphenyl-2,3-diol dehydrogenase [Rhodococcus opacus]
MGAMALDGRVVVVTGGARGQGWEEAGQLAAEGATVVVTDVLEPEGELPDGVVYRRLDVTSPSGWADLAGELKETYGSIFGLVNNAGIVGARGRAGRLEDISLDDWNKLIEVNTTGPFLGIQTLAPLMTNGGSIVNISSIAGAGAHLAAGYGVSKWALRGLSRIASMELGPRGIRVNSILPGYIHSPMQDQTPQQFIDAHLSLIPLGRVGSALDVAPLVLFLMSDASSWISGVDIPVDGGALGHLGLRIISDAMTAATNGA